MNKTHIPQTDSIEALARFWDEHDLIDFEDQLEGVMDRFSERSGGATVRSALQRRELESVKRLVQAEEPVECVSPQTQEAKMTNERFPPGWNEERVLRVLSHYEKQTDEEAAAEDETAFKGKRRTVIEVPVELVPVIREVLAQYKATARA